MAAPDESKHSDGALCAAIRVHMFATGPKCTDRTIGAVELVVPDTTPGPSGVCAHKWLVHPPEDMTVVSTIEPLTGISITSFKDAAKDPIKVVAEQLQAALRKLGDGAVLWGHASAEFSLPARTELGIQHLPYKSIADKFKHANLPGSKWAHQFFTFEVVARVMLGMLPAALVADGAYCSAVLQLAQHAPPTEEQSQAMRRQARATKSFAARNATYDGVCMGHIASGPYGWACACRTRTRTRRKW